MRMFFLASIFVLLCACGGSASTPDAQRSPRGENGRFSFHLQAEAFHVGPNTFELQLHDLDEQPVAGARATAVAEMKAHDHPAVHATASELAPGTYRIEEWVLSMPGAWTLTFEADAGGMTDRWSKVVDVR